MRGNKSFANEYGITHKPASSSGLGLNPNLNIEDEYIENLLKQTHFLNMEIKLIKEKQKENKGMGIMGLLNKDTNPVVTHAIDSNAKYSTMKNNLSSMVNNAETEYLRLDDENYAVKAQRDAVEKLSLKEEQVNIQNKIYVQKNLSEANEKMNDCLRKLKELREENRRTGDNYQRLFNQWDDLTNKTKTKDLVKKITSNIEKENQDLRVHHFQANLAHYTALKKKIDDADALFRSEAEYKKLVDQNNELKDRVKQTDKELFDTSYKAKEMEELKKLSIRNKDIEAELKKQAQQEAERLKKKLSDRKNDFQLKLKDSKAGLESNDEVRLSKGKVARKDKQISDLKKKNQITEGNYKRLREQVMKLTAAVEEQEKNNKQNQAKLGDLLVLKNSVDVALTNSQLQEQRCSSDLKSTESTLAELKGKLQQFQQQLAYLMAKEQFLVKQIDLDEGIKRVKIEQLNTLKQENEGLNSTIEGLMDKWGQIVKFSRDGSM